MRLSVAELAGRVHGDPEGDTARLITGAAGLSHAGPSDVSFLRSANDSGALRAFEATAAGAVFLPKGVESRGRTVIRVANPVAAFAVVLAVLEAERRVEEPGVHPTAVVPASASIGRDVFVGPHCVIGEGVVIGDGCRLDAQVFVGARARLGAATRVFPQVVVREDVVVGSRCILHAGCVIGSDGYGFYFADGKHNKIPQIGNVVIEDDVEIGSCTTIDRATTGSTVIKRGVKIDNLVQIAHNVEVGETSLIVAQTGIAGSSRIGRGVVLAGQVGVADHVTIGDRAQIAAQSGIRENVPEGAVLFGSPAQPITDTMKQHLLIQRLPELFRDVKKLKKGMGAS